MADRGIRLAWHFAPTSNAAEDAGVVRTPAARLRAVGLSGAARRPAVMPCGEVQHLPLVAPLHTQRSLGRRSDGREDFVRARRLDLDGGVLAQFLG